MERSSLGAKRIGPSPRDSDIIVFEGTERNQLKRCVSFGMDFVRIERCNSTCTVLVVLLYGSKVRKRNPNP